MSAPTPPGGANPINELGLIYSRFCNAACAHCGSNSGPAAKGTMPLAYVERSVADAARLGIGSLMVSGGEPLAFFRDMCRVAELAQRAGLGLQLCSNGYWGDRVERAREWLAALRERGLEVLLLSTDRFHLEYVPLPSVITAANVAEELAIPCQIAVPASARDWRATNLVATLQRETNAAVYTHPVHPVGRGEGLAPHHFRWQPLRVGPCHLVGHVEVDYDGTVSVCPTSADFDRSSPLILGNVATTPLGELLVRFRATPLYRVIAAWGPLGLHALANATTATGGPGLRGPLHDCHLCRELTRDDTIVRRVAERTGIDLLEPIDGEEFARIDALVGETIAAAPSTPPDGDAPEPAGRTMLPMI